MCNPVNIFRPSDTKANGKLRAPLCHSGWTNFSPTCHHNCPAPPNFPFPGTSLLQSRGVTGDPGGLQSVKIMTNRASAKNIRLWYTERILWQFLPHLVW